MLSITDSLLSGLDSLFEWLPRLLGAIVILIIALIIARVVRKLAERLLGRVGLDERLRNSAGTYVDRLGEGFSASRLIGKVLFWVIVLIGVAVAADALGISSLQRGIGVVINYLPNVIAAVVILVVAALIAGVAGRAIGRLMGPSPIGKIASTAVPIVIITIAAFMALAQLKIATQIVVATYLIVLASIGLGAALAFGLGGRDAAKKTIEEAYERGKGSSA